MTQRITLALGIDAGGTRSGIALVRLDPQGWMHIDYGAHLDNESDAIRRAIVDCTQRLGVVAIETLVGFAYEAKRVQALVETARFEGRVLELCRMLGESRRLQTTGIEDELARTATVAQYSAGEVRGALCRSRTASDEQVRIVVEGVTLTRPQLLAVARPHVYDAALTAIYTIGRSLAHGWHLPPAVEQRLHEQRERERASRAAKKAAGAPPAEKRSPTRAQSKRRSEAATRAWRGRSA